MKNYFMNRLIKVEISSVFFMASNALCQVDPRQKSQKAGSERATNAIGIMCSFSLSTVSKEKLRLKFEICHTL